MRRNQRISLSIRGPTPPSLRVAEEYTGALYRRDYCLPQAAFATVCEEGISEQVLQSMVVSTLTGMVVDVCNLPQLLVTRKKDLSEIAKSGEIRSTLGTVRTYDYIYMEKAS